jgi:uncharacterized protein (DUF362 family)/ferredoxin-like protein FixX
MSKVAIIKCNEYRLDKVKEAIEKGINLLGGIDKFVNKEDKILLKPNMLSAKEANKHVTTHPTILQSVATILIEKGYENVFFGDSPAKDNEEKTANINGLAQAGSNAGISQVDMSYGKTVGYPNGHQCKRFEIAQAVIDCDSIINLSKMKTHQLTRITGAVKNTFGCVYGLNKAAMHTSFPNAIDFSKMLVDLNLLLKPKLYIMDGIVAMEGNGPGAGDPIQMGVIIMSDDPVAVDTTFCKMVGLDPKFIPTITYGQQWGLGVYDDNRIEYLGDNIDQFVNKEFDVVRAPVQAELPKITSLVRRLALRKPYIINDECIKCGQCIEVCPAKPKALSRENKNEVPKYDYSKCIRCYCCQETCPAEAIDVKTPLLGKLFFYN